MSSSRQLLTKQRSSLDRARRRAAAEKLQGNGLSSAPAQASDAIAPGTRLRPSRNLLTAAIAALLVLATLLVFAQTIRHDFVNFDDEQYITKNLHVRHGLTWQTVAWAFTTSKYSYWNPLTWISHAWDCQLFGLWAGGHHLTGVLLHCVNVVLLFLLLSRATGRLWISALATALFAIHPLRVESVAWAAERKDLLSALFFLVCLAAYGNYATKPFRLRRYLAVVVLFVLALLSKPMVVTLPFVLLLLDYWPLGRMGHRAAGMKCGAASQEQAAWSTEHGATGSVHETGTAQRQETSRPRDPASRCKRPAPSSLAPASPARLLAEKVPLLLLAAVSCGITVFTHRSSLHDLSGTPLAGRLANALIAYTAYLGQFLWPARLAVVYPYSPSARGALDVALAAISLSVITVTVVLCRRRYPFLLVGWLWYLGILVPVSGLIQVGVQVAMADRYTYLSLIGPVAAAVLFCAAWAKRDRSGEGAQGILDGDNPFLADPLRGHPAVAGSVPLRRGPALLAGIGLAVFAVAAWRQTAYWRDSRALWLHAIECTADNYVALYSLGCDAQQRGQLDEAVDFYRQAIEICPEHDMAHDNLGLVLTKQGKAEEGFRHFLAAIDANRRNVHAHINLGNALARTGNMDAAIAQYRTALETDSDCAEAWNDLAATLARRDRADEAIAGFQTALEIDPRYVDARINLGIALSQLGQTTEAAGQLRQVLEIDPGNGDALWNLGVISFQQGDVPAALTQWREVVRLQPKAVQGLERLAWVLATSPRADCRSGAEAAQLAEHAARLSRRDPAVLRTLAAAYAECGRFPQALKTAREALDKLAAPQDDPVRAALKKEIDLYRAATPLRQPQ